MHTLQTFILRLFIDLDALDRLCGSVQAITEKESHPFTSEEKLVALLRLLILEASREQDHSPEEMVNKGIDP
jgi:hypothetical protein